MSQSHLTLDFPMKAPASAKTLTEELPPLMPDFAKTQDNLGTVHFSRFMVKGDQKLLFLSDIDGEIEDHIKRLVTLHAISPEAMESYSNKLCASFAEGNAFQ